MLRRGSASLLIDSSNPPDFLRARAARETSHFPLRISRTSQPNAASTQARHTPFRVAPLSFVSLSIKILHWLPSCANAKDVLILPGRLYEFPRFPIVVVEPPAGRQPIPVRDGWTPQGRKNHPLCTLGQKDARAWNYVRLGRNLGSDCTSKTIGDFEGSRNNGRAKASTPFRSGSRKARRACRGKPARQLPV